MNEEIPKQDPENQTPEVAASNTFHEEIAAHPDDKFPRGKIVRFFPQSRYGFIKDRMGRDIYFNLEEVRFVGEKGDRDVMEGQIVGYDVGWTSHGLHVTYLKIF
jgi:cold shock CspA family protein